VKISIIGAGIAGLGCAILLKQEGYEVCIYERNSEISDIGAGIVCWPNATFVLDKLNVLDEISKVSGQVSFMKRFNIKEELLNVLDIKKINDIMNYTSYSILRRDLMKILFDKAIELDIPIHFNHNMILIKPINTEQTQIKFENKQEVISNMVIGADGRMNSLTRAYVNGDNFPVFQGFINWVGILESENDLFPNLDVLDYWGTGCRFGIVPINSKKAYWAAGMSSSLIEKKDPSLYKQEINSIFKNAPSLINEVINKTDTKDINKLYIHDHHPISSWYKNNVLLIGDCAHAALPTSGQGACQALEDAWHLTQSLKIHKNNIQNSFEYFNKLRQKKTDSIIHQGRQLASTIFNDDNTFCAQRDEKSQNSIHVDNTIGIASFWSMDLPINI